MGNVSKYKTEMLNIAISFAEKEQQISRYFGMARLTDTLRKKVEFTGDPDKDVGNIMATIREMVTEINRNCL